MLKFKNKDGKEVMEMTDNGDLNVNDTKLEESFKKQEVQLKENTEEAE